MKINLGDLASVAGTNAYLKQITNGAFIRLYADKELELNIDSMRKLYIRKPKNDKNVLTRAIDAIRILNRFGPLQD